MDTAGIHRAHEQNKDKGGGEQKHAVDAHRENRQNTSSNRNKQVPEEKKLMLKNKAATISQLVDGQKIYQQLF